MDLGCQGCKIACKGGLFSLPHLSGLPHLPGVLHVNRPLVCGFVASSYVLIFAVIGRNTINIPEIFQVFTVFRVWLNVVGSG